MKSSDELFQLIKSLKQTEKRYFKLEASKHVFGEKNSYVKLFDAIDKQKVYNEDKLKVTLKKENLVNQLHVAKNYLYKLILKALQNYYYDNSIDAQLKNHLREIEILFERALYKQCKKILIKAKKIAYEYEKHTTLMDLIKWEKKLLQTGVFAEELDKKMEAVYDEERKALSNIRNIVEYWLLDSSINLLIEREGLPRNEQEVEKFNYLIDHPLLKNEELAQSLSSRIYFYNILANYFYVKDDTRNDYEYTKKLVKLVESETRQIINEPSLYLEFQHNFLIACLRLQNYDEFIIGLNKLRNFTGDFNIRDSEDIRARIFLYSYSMELKMLLGLGKFDKGALLMPEIEEGLLRFNGKMNKSHEIVFYYNIAYLHMGLGMFQKALRWLHRILNDQSFNIRQDILSFTRILSLILHFELRDNDILEYALKSTYRFLRTRNRLYEFEKLVLNYIRRIPRLDSEDELIDSFRELRAQLEQLIHQPYERKALEYFDLISWLESKTDQKSFADVIRSKAKKAIG